ncbi:hypothetical protein [Streptomyces brasiliensis]|uniref:Uncharacterized protein n=1 Tax=Streptomyces brasiliensis TaxID=1954 RepID=A0A917KXM1_9ACTN|nr:hypothetical protein [Streptomyces brasiliensis]GGJ34775.1 hypothetical protein GCM10010121_052560 [Streptomyces brasiliensis]
MSDRAGWQPTLVVFGVLPLVLPGVDVRAHDVRAHRDGPHRSDGLGAGGRHGQRRGRFLRFAPEQFAIAGRLSEQAVGTVATTAFAGLTPYLSQALIVGGRCRT